MHRPRAVIAAAPFIALAVLSGQRGPQQEPTPRVSVEVDSTNLEVQVTVGPLHFEAIATDAHAVHDESVIITPVFPFEWPVDGWLRGFRVNLRDGHGRPVPRDVMHLIMVNYARRQLVYRAAERIMGAAAETENLELPFSIGVPMERGMRLGLYAKRHYHTAQALDSVYVEVVLLWTRADYTPRPVDALPIYMDANLTVGGSNEFDVPPGRSEKEFVFTLPVGGYLFGVGGHLHDHGVGLRLEDAETGAMLARLAAERDTTGRLLAVERRVFGLRGLRLEEGHRYRIVGVYDNPTADTLSDWAMAHMDGLFLPDSATQVPALDLDDPVVRRDLEALRRQGEPRAMPVGGQRRP